MEIVSIETKKHVNLTSEKTESYSSALVLQWMFRRKEKKKKISRDLLQ